jgi:hypothetical protein
MVAQLVRISPFMEPEGMLLLCSEEPVGPGLNQLYKVPPTSH